MVEKLCQVDEATGHIASTVTNRREGKRGREEH